MLICTGICCAVVLAPCYCGAWLCRQADRETSRSLSANALTLYTPSKDYKKPFENDEEQKDHSNKSLCGHLREKNQSLTSILFCSKTINKRTLIEHDTEQDTDTEHVVQKGRGVRMFTLFCLMFTILQRSSCHDIHGVG